MNRLPPAIVLVIAALYGLSFWSLPAIDFDLGWHLLGGAWILDHHQVPRSDIINAFNTSWQDYHWFAQVLMFKLYQAGGFQALQISVGIATAGFFLLLICIQLHSSPSGLKSKHLLLLAAAAFFLQLLAQPRPQLYALIPLALAMMILLRAPRWELPALFLLTVLLANVHVYWVFIPLLWCLYRVAPRALGKHGPAPRYAWGGLLLISLAAFVSPYGLFQHPLRTPEIFLNYLVLLDYLSMPAVLKNSIGELKSPLGVRWWPQIVMLLYFALLIRSCTKNRALADLPAFLSAWVGFVLAAMAVKYTPVFAIMSMPWLSRHMPRPLIPAPFAPFVSKSAILTALGLFTFYCALACTSGFPRSYDQTLLASLQPIEACAAIPALTEQRDHTTRVLTPFDNGGWCRWILYQQAPSQDFRVTTDNRTQWVPGRHYELADDIFAGRGNWYATLQRWDPDFAVVPQGYSLSLMLRGLTEQWTLIQQDASFLLFKRNRQL